MVPAEVLGAIEDPGALLGVVLDQTHDCIKLLDHDGTIRYVNERGAIAMELRTPSELIGLNWVERWPAAARPAVERAMAEALSGKAARFSASRVIGDKQSWWDVTVTPARSAPAIEHLLVIARDMTIEVEERERVAAVSAEMRHRLRNAMTIAAALMNMAARGRPELQDFTNEVTSRLAQLGRIQELVLDPSSRKSFGQTVSLLGSIYPNLEIGPLPDIEVDDRLMQAVALTFGELATNSLKYGALKRGAHVRVGGRLARGELELEWEEETVFGEAREGGQGFGLIDRIIRISGGRIERSIDDRKFTARAFFPLEA